MVNFYAPLNFWASDDSCVSVTLGWRDWAASAFLDAKQYWGLAQWQVLFVWAPTVKEG